MKHSRVRQGQMVLYLKLFFVLGIFWIFESIEFIIYTHYGEPSGPTI